MEFIPQLHEAGVKGTPAGTVFFASHQSLSRYHFCEISSGWWSCVGMVRYIGIWHIGYYLID